MQLGFFEGFMAGLALGGVVLFFVGMA